jgi:hypothetical protein
MSAVRVTPEQLGNYNTITSILQSPYRRAATAHVTICSVSHRLTLSLTRSPEGVFEVYTRGVGSTTFSPKCSVLECLYHKPKAYWLRRMSLTEIVLVKRSPSETTGSDVDCPGGR